MKSYKTTNRFVYVLNIKLSMLCMALLLGLFIQLPAHAQVASFDATEASPESSIAWLKSKVESVVNTERLSKESNAARHLLHYLDRATGTYLKGMPDHAARHLSIFIDKVERLQRAHRVSEEMCVLFIDTSESIITTLHEEHALTGALSSDTQTGISDKVAGKSSSLTGLSNSPNPFNPTTTIRFSLAEEAQVNLTVYDMTGREVRQLVNGHTNAGNHEIQFDASALPSGTYLYRLSTPNSQVVQKMLLLK